MDGMERWRDRVAVVTGASGGIGRAVAVALAEDGMRVAVAARSEDKLGALAAEIESDGGEVLAVPCDVRDEAQVLDLFAKVRTRWGGTDVMINNAGLGYAEPLVSGRTERWREMLEVNVLGLCVCTREAVKDMRERGDRGYVIHVSSMAGHRVPSTAGVYSASKFAVRALTEGLRQELRGLGSKIRVTAISPGFVETGFAAHYHGSEEAAAQTYGTFKVLQPEDIASLVRYALSQPPHVQLHDVLLRPTEQRS